MATVASLQDAFTDNSLNASLWSVSNSGSGASALEQNGRLELHSSTTENGFGRILSVDAALNFDESSAYCRVVWGGQGEPRLRLYDAQGDGYQISIYFGVLTFIRLVAFAENVLGTIDPYVASTHRWWRQREASGTTYLETAPDGVDSTVPGTWTERYSEATNSNADFSHTAVVAVLQNVNVGIGDDVAHFVGFNTAATGGGGPSARAVLNAYSLMMGM